MISNNNPYYAANNDPYIIKSTISIDKEEIKTRMPVGTRTRIKKIKIPRMVPKMNTKRYLMAN